MPIKSILKTVIVLSLFSSNLFAAGPSDDSDISGGAPTMRSQNSNLVPDAIQEVPTQEGTYSFDVVRYIKEQPVAVEGLNFAVVHQSGISGSTQTDPNGFAWGYTQCAPGETIQIAARLEDHKLTITNGSTVYTVSQTVKCGMHTRLSFTTDSGAGQAIGIWQIARAGEVKLSQYVGLGFWNRKVRFEFPADSDYYSWGTVHISRGDHWDVVGHEFGHAIYALAGVGQSEGGQHFIDRCYSGTLALSEGWASYFSAWISVGLDDSDAKFEYMVPRRAPIRFENVPDDVCQGMGSEWRVNAFLWDFIDLNNDGEVGQENFITLWNALYNANARDASAVASRLERAGVQRELIDLVWALNFRTERE